MKLTKDTPRLEEAVAFHNGVTQWTICNITKEFTAAKRADVIVKFIDVAMVCMSVCLSVCNNCMYVYLYYCIILYVCMSVCITVLYCMCVCLSVCITVLYCICVCLSVCITVCVFVH